MNTDVSICLFFAINEPEARQTAPVLGRTGGSLGETSVRMEAKSPGDLP